MAIKYFTNAGDPGEGSLRATWSSLSDGDIAEPDPDVFGGKDAEILFSNYFPTPQPGTYTLRKGKAKRLILNGQDAKYFFAFSRAGLNLIFEDVDFVHGRRAQNAPFSGAKFESLTFRRCLFANNYGGACGFLRANCSVAASVSMESCVAYGNKNAASAGQVVDIASDTTTTLIKGCTFGRSFKAERPDVTFEDDEKGTIVDSLIEKVGSSEYQNIDFSTVGFVDLENDDFRLTKDSPYATGAESFTADDLDFLGRPRKVGGAIGAFEFYSESAFDELFGDYADLARYALEIKTNPDSEI